ncbi:MAG: hypothetical protein AAF184_23240 [Pseudomonadota bacterium]
MRGPGVLLLILAVLAIEAALLSALASRRGPAPASSRSPLKGTLANLAAGACLVFAMLASTLEAHWGWNALFLTGAFLAHLVDLSDRW